MKFTKEQVEEAFIQAMMDSGADAYDAEDIAEGALKILFPPKTVADWPRGWDVGFRADLQGMWGKVDLNKGGRLVIISAPNWDWDENGQNATCKVTQPGNDYSEEYAADQVQVMEDLPRAWTRKGEPVPGEWDDDNGHNSMRRFQSEWEWKHDTPQHIIDQHTKDIP